MARRPKVKTEMVSVDCSKKSEQVITSGHKGGRPKRKENNRITMRPFWIYDSLFFVALFSVLKM
ncbi:MAG TPA: hypothetical protein DEQ73_02530 [Phycisphaerales bacterium]|nr:hypothetical protein [Phycisphaerales bacterium]